MDLEELEKKIDNEYDAYKKEVPFNKNDMLVIMRDKILPLCNTCEENYQILSLSYRSVRPQKAAEKAIYTKEILQQAYSGGEERLIATAVPLDAHDTQDAYRNLEFCKEVLEKLNINFTLMSDYIDAAPNSYLIDYTTCLSIQIMENGSAPISRINAPFGELYSRMAKLKKNTRRRIFAPIFRFDKGSQEISEQVMYSFSLVSNLHMITELHKSRTKEWIEPRKGQIEQTRDYIQEKIRECEQKITSPASHSPVHEAIEAEAGARYPGLR